MTDTSQTGLSCIVVPRAELEEVAEAFGQALDAWAAKLCYSPSIAERKRYNAALVAFTKLTERLS